MKQEIKERIEMIQRGEVPEGYERNKLFAYPNDWEIIKLGQVENKIGSGKTPKGGESVYLCKGVPFIRSQNVLDHKFSANNLAFISKETHEEMSATKVFPNDVLLNITGASIGRCCLVPGNIQEGNLSQHVCVIRTKPLLDKRYLMNIILSNIGQKQIMLSQAGGNREGLNFQQVRNIAIPAPPISEQKKIASILSTWDKAIELKEQLIEEKKKLKKGLMQSLLTGKVRLLGFEGEWEEVQLADILDYEQPTKYLVKDILGFSRERIPVLTANKTFIIGSTKDKHGIYTDYPVIIFDDFTTENKYVNFPFKVKSSAIKMLKAKTKNVDIKFVYELMQHLKFPVGEHKRYYLSEYQHTYVCLPSQEEQFYIAGISKTADSEIALLEQELDLLKQQKKGLMQLLLTGIVRVPVETEKEEGEQSEKQSVR